MNTFSTKHINPFGFVSVMQKALPWRFRRMLVLAGTYGALTSMEKALRSHATELSEVLHLSNDPDSVAVPIKFHSVFVAKFNTLNVEVQGHTVTLKDAATRSLKDTERKALAESLAEHVPASLCYSHLGCMVEDITRLLSFVENKRLAMR